MTSEEWDSLTRTEQGYAWWKEDPKRVREARIQAKGIIAQRELWRILVLSWVAPAVEWCSRRLTRT